MDAPLYKYWGGDMSPCPIGIDAPVWWGRAQPKLSLVHFSLKSDISWQQF